MPGENLDLQKRMKSIGNGENVYKFNFQIATLSIRSFKSKDNNNALLGIQHI